MTTLGKRRATRRKIFAIAAGGAALGLGVSATLAAWTDSEWVYGGDGLGGPGIATSEFNVQQNTDAPTYDAGSWTDEESNPGGVMIFAPGALLLTPGDSTYAAVALRTDTDSVAGDVTLQAAVAATGITINDTGGDLFTALDVRVAALDSTYTCDVTAFAGGGGNPAVIVDDALDGGGDGYGAAAQTLAADSGNVYYYCFEITLPSGASDSLQGRSVAPAWEFSATSN